MVRAVRHAARRGDRTPRQRGARPGTHAVAVDGADARPAFEGAFPHPLRGRAADARWKRPAAAARRGKETGRDDAGPGPHAAVADVPVRQRGFARRAVAAARLLRTGERGCAVRRRRAGVPGHPRLRPVQSLGGRSADGHGQADGADRRRRGRAAPRARRCLRRPGADDAGRRERVASLQGTGPDAAGRRLHRRAAPPDRARSDPRRPAFHAGGARAPPRGRMEGRLRRHGRRRPLFARSGIRRQARAAQPRPRLPRGRGSSRRTRPRARPARQRHQHDRGPGRAHRHRQQFRALQGGGPGAACPPVEP